MFGVSEIRGCLSPRDLTQSVQICTSVLGITWVTWAGWPARESADQSQLCTRRQAQGLSRRRETKVG